MTLRDWHFLCIGGNAALFPLALVFLGPVAAAVSGMCIAWSWLRIRELSE